MTANYRPAVDVIMPIYNGARFLRHAVESVLAQTRGDWRILLVDDGSTDETESIAARYQQQLGDRFIYRKQANAGPSAARNTAIHLSTAPYLAMLDADDLWLPQRLEKSLQVFATRPAIGLAYGLISWINPEGDVTHTFDGNSGHAEGRIAPYIYMREVDLPCCSITIRRECLDRVGLFDETLRATEDRDLWLRIALQYEVACIPEIIASYRTSPASATTNPDRMLNNQRHFIQKHYGQPGCGFVARRVALSNIYRQRAGALRDRRQPMAALGSALKALALYPAGISNLRTAASLLLRAGR